MTEQERQEIKAMLIELGFWGADEAGDPAADRRDAMTLYKRAAERLAKGAGLYSTGLTAIFKIAQNRSEARRGQLQTCGWPKLPGVHLSSGFGVA